MPRMVPVHYWPPCVALTDRALWLSNAGATRRFPLDHIVLASPAPSPDGAMRVDFMSGDPLIVLVVDNGSFWGRLGRAIRAVDVRLQMAAPDALGVPELSLRNWRLPSEPKPEPTGCLRSTATFPTYALKLPDMPKTLGRFVTRPAWMLSESSGPNCWPTRARR